MAGALMHAVGIDAEPGKVFDAISTGEGLASFWTSSSKAEPEEGSVAEFGFGGPTLRFRVDELTAGRRILWTNLGDFPNWPGTTVSWDLTQENGQTMVNFSHDGWAAEIPQAELAHVNYTWGQVVGRLKQYVETGKPNPYFS